MRNPEFALIGTINALGKKIRRFCDRNAARLGLTGTQGHVLCFIFIVSQWQDIYQRDIEEEFEIRRSTATGILKLLERDGFIERVSGRRAAQEDRPDPQGEGASAAGDPGGDGGESTAQKPVDG